MYKSTTESIANWQMFDTSRVTYNYSNSSLGANVATQEVTSGPYIDILSNGFKLRTSSGAHNTSGAYYIFAAFAEVPFKYSLAR